MLTVRMHDTTAYSGAKGVHGMMTDHDGTEYNRHCTTPDATKTISNSSSSKDGSVGSKNVAAVHDDKDDASKRKQQIRDAMKAIMGASLASIPPGGGTGTDVNDNELSPPIISTTLPEHHFNEIFGHIPLHDNNNNNDDVMSSWGELSLSGDKDTAKSSWGELELFAEEEKKSNTSQQQEQQQQKQRMMPHELVKPKLRRTQSAVPLDLKRRKEKHQQRRRKQQREEEEDDGSLLDNSIAAAAATRRSSRSDLHSSARTTKTSNTSQTARDYKSNTSGTAATAGRSSRRSSRSRELVDIEPPKLRRAKSDTPLDTKGRRLARRRGGPTTTGKSNTARRRSSCVTGHMN